jgi:hypothetical protein
MQVSGQRQKTAPLRGLNSGQTTQTFEQHMESKHSTALQQSITINEAIIFTLRMSFF